MPFVGGTYEVPQGQITSGPWINILNDIADAINTLEAEITVIEALLPGLQTASIVLDLDGNGVALTTGVKADLYVPFACTITSVTMLADQVGSIVVDIWKDTYANYPPTVADTITAAALPTITAANKSQDTTLTGWTKTVAAGDTLRFNVNSAATVTRLNLSLTVTKS